MDRAQTQRSDACYHVRSTMLPTLNEKLQRVSQAWSNERGAEPAVMSEIRGQQTIFVRRIGQGAKRQLPRFENSRNVEMTSSSEVGGRGSDVRSQILET